jgi:predicted dehydrogenase
MKNLRMAVIGLRGMGRQHVAGIAAHPHALLTAVADLDQENARQIAAAHQARAYADYQEMFAREELDAVAIATPHHLHAPMTLAALEAGLHVLVEKPLAIRISAGDRMVSLAREKGRVLAVGHNYRTFPGNVKLRQIVDSGQLGPIHRILWQWLENRPESYYDRDLWRCTWEHAGGGVLMNQTSHDLDLLCWLFGPPTEVSAAICNRAHRHQVEDTAIASIRFAGGALASVQLSTCDHRLNYRQIAGDHGTLLFQDEANANVNIPQVFRLGIYREPVTRTIRESPNLIGQPEPEWRDVDCSDATSPTLLESFIHAILDGSEPITDGQSALVTLELINAIILAGIRRKVVSLPVDRDEYDELMDELISGRVKVEGISC